MKSLAFRRQSLLASLLTGLLLTMHFQASKTSAQSFPSPRVESPSSDHPGAVDSENIQRLLERLRSSRFADRLDATKRLEAMGVAAHKALGDVVQSGDSESASRAMELLRQAAGSPEPSISKSARKILESIADSQHPRSAEAGRALEPKTLTDNDGRRGFPGFGRMPLGIQGIPGMPNVQPNFGLRFPPGFGGAQGQNNLRIAIRTINGVRQIQITQNNETYEFQDVNGGLEVKRPDGKGGSTTRVYQDVEDLKKKDAGAYEMYRKAGGDRQRGIGQPKVPFANPFEAPRLKRDLKKDSPAPPVQPPKAPAKKTYKPIIA